MKFDSTKRYGQVHETIIEYLNADRWLYILDEMYLEMCHLIPPEYRRRVFWRVSFYPVDPIIITDNVTLMLAIICGDCAPILKINWVYKPRRSSEI